MPGLWFVCVGTSPLDSTQSITVEVKIAYTLYGGGLSQIEQASVDDSPSNPGPVWPGLPQQNPCSFAPHTSAVPSSVPPTYLA